LRDVEQVWDTASILCKTIAISYIQLKIVANIDKKTSSTCSSSLLGWNRKFTVESARGGVKAVDNSASNPTGS